MDTEDNLAEPETEDLPNDEIEQEDEAQPELDDDGNPIEEPEEPEEESDPNLEDVEIDGKTYKVPKDAAFRQADYTRKTMELAEQRKTVEATIDRLTTVSKEETEALSKVAVLDAKLAQFEDIDWQAWDQQNPIEANNARWQLTELQRQRDGAANGYAEAQRKTQLEAQQERAKRLQQGVEVLQKNIPGWNQDKAAAILDFGVKTYGFDPEELRTIDNPLAILVLHDAMEGRTAKAQAATKAKAKATIEKQQAIKPAASLKGASPVAVKGLDDRLSTDEWIRRRMAQKVRQGR